MLSFKKASNFSEPLNFFELLFRNYYDQTYVEFWTPEYD